MAFWIALIKSWLLAEKIDGSRLLIGLADHKDDERDLSYADTFGTASYVPKVRVKDNPTLSVKAQQPFNTCVWASATTQKEVDEGVKLSVRSLVAFGKKSGLLTGTGFASLRSGQDIIQKYGIAEESVLPDTRPGWEEYSSPKCLTYDVVQSASRHKSSKYFLVQTKEDFLHAVESGRIVQTGMTWRTGYQMNGGLRAPWVLTIGSGTLIGGHAIDLRGYDLDKGLLKFQTTFGASFAESGCFYIRINDFFSVPRIGYVSVDATPAQIAQGYEGKDVKSDADPKIYRIQGGQKHWYPNEAIYLSWGGKFNPRTWVAVSSSILASIPTGTDMANRV